MLKSINWNIYTILMVGLVPALLLTAWGVYAWDSHRLHSLQCTMAEEWLEESTDIASQFEQSGTMGQTLFWASRFEDIESPNAAGNLRWGILQSTDYHAENYPELPTNEPGVLNPPNGLFERQFEEGVEDLVDHCPETEAMIPTAFPMVFREEQS